MSGLSVENNQGKGRELLETTSLVYAIDGMILLRIPVDLPKVSFTENSLAWLSAWCASTPNSLVLLQRIKQAHMEKRLQVYVSVENQNEPLQQLIDTMDLIHRNASDITAAQKRRTFSSRENSVLAHLASGLTNKDIANHLNISVRTVKFHVSNILAKTGYSSRSQIVVAFADMHTAGIMGEGA